MPSSVSKSSLKFQFMHAMLCVLWCDTAPAAGQLCPAALGINLSRVTTFRRRAVGKSIANVAVCMARQVYAPWVACSRAKSKKRVHTSRLSPKFAWLSSAYRVPHARAPRAATSHQVVILCPKVVGSKFSTIPRNQGGCHWKGSTSGPIVCADRLALLRGFALEASTPQNLSGTFLRQSLWASQPVR